jgi:hypothetical protein
MAGNQMQPFGYRLHDRHSFGVSAVNLEGVPQIPAAAHRYMACEGSEGDVDLPPNLRRQCDEAIEAACWVLKNRHDRHPAADPNQLD